jgi:uncharacterized protein
MKAAVSNSGPLIHLINAGLFDLLLELFDKIFIPKLVYKEVVVRGKKEGHSDAFIIERAIKDNIIIVKSIEEPYLQKEHSSFKLHLGELSAINLAIELNMKLILLDDEEARLFALKFPLKVKGSLGILSDILKNNFINLSEALDYLKKLNSVMFLSSDVFKFMEEELRKIA